MTRVHKSSWQTMASTERWRLYTAYAFSAWNDRQWEFASVIFLIDLFGGSLLFAGVLGLCETAVGILMGPRIGAFIDKSDRLQGISKRSFNYPIYLILWGIKLFDSHARPAVGTEHLHRNWRLGACAGTAHIRRQQVGCVVLPCTSCYGCQVLLHWYQTVVSQGLARCHVRPCSRSSDGYVSHSAICLDGCSSHQC
jgi:hypothetical protein